MSDPAPLTAQTSLDQLVAAQNVLRKTYTADLMSAYTRGERDRLLAASVIAIAFSIGQQPSELSFDGAKYSITSP